MQEYTDTITKMYGGSKEEITLRCQTELIDNVIDKFGKKVKISNVTADNFDVTATVCVSSTFLAWVFKYAGLMVVISPKTVKEMYADMLHQAMNDSISGNFTDSNG